LPSPSFWDVKNERLKLWQGAALKWRKDDTPWGLIREMTTVWMLTLETGVTDVTTVADRLLLDAETAETDTTTDTMIDMMIVVVMIEEEDLVAMETDTMIDMTGETIAVVMIDAIGGTTDGGMTAVTTDATDTTDATITTIWMMTFDARLRQSRPTDSVSSPKRRPVLARTNPNSNLDGMRRKTHPRMLVSFIKFKLR
jgi:hypothetical protein